MRKLKVSGFRCQVSGFRFQVSGFNGTVGFMFLPTGCMLKYPNPDEPELKIEDCRLNICGCRFAPSFLKWKEFLSEA